MKTTMTRLVAALAALGALLAAALLLAGGANAATYPPTSSQTGGVTVSNHHPKPGGTIVVHGQGCTPGAKVTVFFDNQPIGVGTTNPAGRYNITVKIPSNAAQGHHTISVSVANGSCPGSGVEGIDVVASNSTSGGGGTLAGTGVAVVGIGALGVVLLVGGGMMLLAGRRRNSTHA